MKVSEVKKAKNHELIKDLMYFALAPKSTKADTKLFFRIVEELNRRGVMSKEDTDDFIYSWKDWLNWIDLPKGYEPIYEFIIQRRRAESGLDNK